MRRQAFTLVELLVVIAILALLASMMLFALAGAEGTAKEMRTRSTITKLHNLIMQKYESYLTRRVPITVPAGNNRPLAFARHRLNVLREIMRLEMPDRYTDIYDAPVNPVTAGTLGPPIGRPSVNYSYLKSLPSVLRGTQTDFDNNIKTYSQYQGAECLYLIISRGSDDPEVMEQFSASEIGDADGDGMSEFLDGWGNPISFLRWAPGFVSALQPKNAAVPFYTEHDPFDPRGLHRPPNDNQSADPAWYQEYSVPTTIKSVHPPLYPLIFSSGPDGEQGIFSDTDLPLHYYKTTLPPVGIYSGTSSPPNNPYFPVVDSDGNKSLIGSPLKDSTGVERTSHIDNITNHNLGP